MTESVPPAPPEGPRCYRHPERETYIRCQRCENPICPDCMNSAAVGFQCPSCVREGARSVRSAQRPFGGALGGNPMATSIGLIVANVAVWLLITADGGASSRIVDTLALTPQAGYRGDGLGGVEAYAGVSSGAYWQLITNAFTHVATVHLLLNMVALYLFGPSVEQVLGRLRFLAVYVGAALTASAGVMLFENPAQGTVGASGAIYGLLGAVLIISYRVGGDYRTVLGWLGINLLLTFTISNISWQGHIGGLIGGMLITAGMVYAPRERRGLIQALVVAAVVVAALVLIVVRIGALGSVPIA